MIAVVFGVAFIAAFFLFFGLQLDSKEHGVLRNLLIIFSFSSLLLIPNALINQQVCEPVLNNSMDTLVYGNNLTGYHWDDYSSSSTAPPEVTSDVFLFHTNTTNTYSDYCYTPLEGGKGFLKAVNLAYLVFIAYLIVYLGYKSLLWMYKSVTGGGKR